MIVYTALQTLTKDMLTNRGVTVYEFAWFRSLFNMIASFLIMKHVKVQIARDIPRLLYFPLAVRSLTGTFAFLCFVGAVYYLPLSIFFIIFNAAPFSTAVLGWCWNREKITAFEIIAMICAFAGVIMIGIAKREQES